MSQSLQEFMDLRRVSHARWNITGMGKQSGKYFVSDDDYGEFLFVYFNHVFERRMCASLLERHPPEASPLLIDLDFRFPKPVERQYTDEQIHLFISAYTEAIHHFIIRDKPLRFFIQETPAPQLDVSKDLCKDGLHIVCPDLIMKYEDIFTLRKYVLDTDIIKTAFPGNQMEAKDCLDESVIQRNNWFMYGSTKPDRKPYAVTKCYVLELDGILTKDDSTVTSMEYLSELSIHVNTVSDYSIRPDTQEEWTTWSSLSDIKPTKTKKTKPEPKADIIPYTIEDNESVSTHRSEQISKLMKQPDLIWEVHEEGDGFKLTHNSKQCLVERGHEHSMLNHSCIMVNTTQAVMVCFSHKKKKLPHDTYLALWNMLRNNEIDKKDDIEERYEVLKVAFEQTHFRILDPPGYMSLVGDVWVHYNRSLLVDMNSGLFVDDDKKIKFTDKWLKDGTIRTYARTGYYVDQSECPLNIFNTFTGLAGSRIPLIEGETGDITPILEHISIICNHQAEAIEFLIDWLADIVQHPGILNGIALIIIGQHGCGKDIFISWFGTSIIGMENYFKTARPQVDLFGSFNSSRKNVLFYHIEEVNPTSIQPSMVEQFKNCITDPYASIQLKNKNTTTGESLLKNYNNFVGTSNHSVPFKIERTERRIFAVKASSEKCKNQEYFKRLMDAMNNPIVAREFYEYLKKRDLSKRDWNNPPSTPALEAWKEECMAKLEPFIDWYRVKNGSDDILASQLYNSYIEWCELMENEEILSKTAFGVELKEIQSIAKGRISAGIIYKFQ